MTIPVTSDHAAFARSGDWRCLDLYDHLKALKSQAALKQEVLGNEVCAWCDRAGEQAVPLLKCLGADKDRLRVRRLLFALIVTTTPADHVIDDSQPFWMVSEWAGADRHGLGGYMAEFFRDGK